MFILQLGSGVVYDVAGVQLIETTRGKAVFMFKNNHTWGVCVFIRNLEERDHDPGK